MISTERVRQLLDPTYVGSLGARSLDDLRDMKVECNDVENALSYLRRLAQARIEILQAESDRRAQGGSVGDLVRDLPRILSAESGRSTIADTRVPPPDAPAVELHWPDGREELASTLERLRDFERELSESRRGLHGVIDTIEREIAARQVAGTT